MEADCIFLGKHRYQLKISELRIKATCMLVKTSSTYTKKKKAQRTIAGECDSLQNQSKKLLAYAYITAENKKRKYVLHNTNQIFIYYIEELFGYTQGL